MDRGSWHCAGGSDQDHPQEKEIKKAKLLSDETIQIPAAAAAKLLQSCPTLPHRRQPTRLPHPWDSPGKNTGVGCHCLLWQISENRRKAKGKGEKEIYIHLNAEFQRTARRDKKVFFSDQCKEIEENNRLGKTIDFLFSLQEREFFSSRKLEIPREHFMQRWG